ncbi:Ryanodine receptor Ryr [candidate division KSB1 bacterium]|nr:Ryanodine receptor Ryr [candidate division KSB1 bacterium]
MTYKPKPIDTSKIFLSNELIELRERLAENAHDNWAKQRITNGWKYESVRDDLNKKHPDLVPYSDLPDSEKKLDRELVLETLKSIIVLGYKIEKKF